MNGKCSDVALLPLDSIPPLYSQLCPTWCVPCSTKCHHSKNEFSRYVYGMDMPMSPLNRVERRPYRVEMSPH
jgi:hypothetical protein